MKFKTIVKKIFLTLTITGSLISTARASDVLPVSSTLHLGAFVDAYYAYDLNRPRNFDRAYTTQPARHNEFNLNLAYVEVKKEGKLVRGRVALQAGTSVQSNYAGEPSTGSNSGPTLARNIQEAYAGYAIGLKTWIDAGIMFSHIGLESFISKDNLTYTRSLVADYSPYYETGVRVTSELSDQLSVQVLVLNGWQNISESNSEKALGTQVSFAYSPELSLAYNTFFGTESGSFRHFHDFVLKYSPSTAWNFGAQADVGFQARSPGGENARWSGFTLIGKRNLNSVFSIVARLERYSDPKNVLITPLNGSHFAAWGGSLGTDTILDTAEKSLTLWRNEVRAIFAGTDVFENRSGFINNDIVFVSYLSSSS